MCFVSALDFRPTNQSTPNSDVLPWETFSSEERERHTKRHGIILLTITWNEMAFRCYFWSLLILLVEKKKQLKIPGFKYSRFMSAITCMGFCIIRGILVHRSHYCFLFLLAVRLVKKHHDFYFWLLTWFPSQRWWFPQALPTDLRKWASCPKSKPPNATWG